MIKKYFDFRYFFLLESLLKIDKDLHLIISKLSTKDPVAKMLLGLINQDITTNVNYLKPSDKNDDVKFVNDTQVKRFVDAGQDPFDRASNSAKIGRTVRQILTANKISVTDQQIEKFVNSYKNAWDNKYKNVGEGFHLISGEEIRDWYLEKNYVPGGGTLNNSCMRYQETQQLLNIYTENPEVCQLLILLDDKNRLLGRAILWKLIPGTGKSPYYLDRIYTRFDNDAEKFADWFRGFLKDDSDNFSCHFLGNTRGCRVQLKDWKFKLYPYMDTFALLDYDNGILMSFDGEDRNKLIFYIQNTSGHPNVPYHQWSESHQKWFRDSECKWIDEPGDYFPTEECERDYNGNWYHKDDVVYSDFYKGYIYQDYAKELEGFGLVDTNDICDVYDSVKDGKPKDSKKYLLSLIGESDYVKVEIGYNYYYVHKDYVCYDVYNSEFILKEDATNYKKLYNISDEDYEKLSNKFGGFDEVDVNYESFGIYDSYTRTPFVGFLYNNIKRSRKYFVVKEILETFGFKSIYDFYVMKNNDFYKGYSKMCYEHTLDILKKNGLDKTPIIDFINEVDKYLTLDSKNRNYITVNKEFANIKKYGSYVGFYNTMIAEYIKKNKVLDVLNSDEVLNTFTDFIKDREHTYEFTVNDEDIKITNKDFSDYDRLKEKNKLFIQTAKDEILQFTYWYILLNDDDYAYEKFKNKNFMTRIIKIFVRFNDVSGVYSNIINAIRRDFSDDYNFRNLLQETGITVNSRLSADKEVFDDFLKRLK